MSLYMGQDKSKDLRGAAEPERGKTAQLIPQLFFENMYLFTWACVNVLQFPAFPRAGQEWCFQGMFSLWAGRPPSIPGAPSEEIYPNSSETKSDNYVGYYFKISIISTNFLIVPIIILNSPLLFGMDNSKNS